MNDEITTIDESTNNTPKKVPNFLLVLVVLSGLYISTSLIGSVMSIFSGPLSEEALEEELAVLYTSISEVKASGLGEQFVQILETVINHTIFVNNEAFYMTHLTTLITLLVGLVSIVFMLKLKKIGFHLYILYSFLPIVFMYIITPSELILTFSVIITVITSALFALLYGLNLKHMK
ncbi:hypothetical protein CW751_09665 [Brumimicrobium salinarum]|uniref:Uncharacterized protein n=1 Tax=Brumimicrobium salinarum TaxID=2058658 RepID=A0A2I0R228_9FLAO|nr:hypothetical protein [Brumimicrobium salinarum]PKR80627.1 hypothetical protein CW751_09665 [Brumimicrobium salinarum]